MIERTDKLYHITSGFGRSPIMSTLGLGNRVKQPWLRSLRLTTKVLGKRKLSMDKNITVTSLPSILSKTEDL
jgi:hypothetical protein